MFLTKLIIKFMLALGDMASLNKIKQFIQQFQILLLSFIEPTACINCF